jgi:Zn-dependent protease with chaperone function
MTVLPDWRHLTAWCFSVGFCFFTVACAAAVLVCMRTGDAVGPVAVAGCWVALVTPGLALFANLRSRLSGLDLPSKALAEAVICDWRFIILALFPLAMARLYGLPVPADRAARFLIFLLDLVLFAIFWGLRSDGVPPLKGALCERVAGLARAGSLRARKVYVVDQKRPGWFGLLPRKAVILTPDLLDRLSRREIDAIAARQMNHPAGGRLFLALLVFGLLYGAYGSQDFGALFGILAVETAFVAGLLARSDHTANRRATTLTGDPVSLVSALAKLASGRAGGARVRRLSARAGIGMPRLSELVAIQPDASDRYAVETPAVSSR